MPPERRVSRPAVQSQCICMCMLHVHVHVHVDVHAHVTCACDMCTCMHTWTWCTCSSRTRRSGRSAAATAPALRPARISGTPRGVQKSGLVRPSLPPPLAVSSSESSSVFSAGLPPISQGWRLRREWREAAWPWPPGSTKEAGRRGTSPRRRRGRWSTYEGGHSYSRGCSPCMWCGWQLMLPAVMKGHCAHTHEHQKRGSTSVRLRVSASARAAWKS